MPAVHRNTDSRSCGAQTEVIGQSDVYINGLLTSVLGDTNTHGGGDLTASNNDGTVFVNGILINLLDSDSNADNLCPLPGHCSPIANQASADVFACGGSGGPGVVNEGPDPTGEDLYGDTATSADGNSSNSGGSGGGGGGAGSSNSTAHNSTQDSAEKRADRNAPTNVVPPASLENDAAFQAKLDEMIEKYPGLTREELYQIIQGESGFDTTATNPSGATGLFQFMPATAKELGYTTAEIQNMSASQQLQVYDEYLERWNYDGGNHLGVMQAAPAYASRSESHVAYRRGSAAWNQNPGWRPPGGGDITVGSINEYYRKQGLA